MRVENVPELMQHIQSRLPVKEAARTSLLSKSWLHAWSTIPTLRFDVGRGKSMELVDVDRTLIRYLRDNTPIERFELTIDIVNQESTSHAEKWIRHVATKSCLKEISLTTFLWGWRASFTFPDEILASENLTKLRVLASRGVSITTPVNAINCVSLRELHLEGGVCINEEVLHAILSSCKMLAKIALLGCCNGLNTIKVKNLPRLYELQIALNAIRSVAALEISNVPNLGVFSCDLDLLYWRQPQPPLPFGSNVTRLMSLGSSVTRLMLGGVITDNACLDMFKSEFPFLESLTIHMRSWTSGSFHFTSASIKRLSLMLCPHKLIHIQVHAPKLLFFEFGGFLSPSLFLFPVSSLDQFTLSFSLRLPVDANFFLKLREALTLSRYCNLHITADNSRLPLDLDIDDLRTRLMFPPATNVQILLFETRLDECLWERSPFFDGLFEICHPKHVLANPDMRFRHNNHFCRLMLREVLEKKNNTYWTRNLKHVQIRPNSHQQWETLTNFHRSFLDGPAPYINLQFKLNWR